MKKITKLFVLLFSAIIIACLAFAAACADNNDTKEQDVNDGGYTIGATEALMSSFEKILAEPNNFKADMSAGDSTLSGYLYLDFHAQGSISNLSPENIELRAKFGNINLWIEQGYAYLAAGEDKIAVSFDGFSNLSGGAAVAAADAAPAPGMDVLTQLMTGTVNVKGNKGTFSTNLTFDEMQVPLTFEFEVDEQRSCTLTGITASITGLNLKLEKSADPAPAALTDKESFIVVDGGIAKILTFLVLTTAEQTGELIDFSLDVGLLYNSGMLYSPFNGNLQLRLNPSAVLSGDYYSVAQAQLHLDLTPAAPILGLVGSFAPAGSLPPFVGSALNNMDVYYTGDGVITLALNNAENAPLFVTQADLKTVQMPALPEDGTSSQLPPDFKFEMKENGCVLALGDSLVTVIDGAYQQLVKTAADYVVASAGGPESPWGGIAGQLVNTMLGATITNVELFVGTNDDGKLTVDFAIKGIPLLNSDGELGGEDAVEIRLLSLTFTENAPLTAEQQTALAAGKDTADKLLAQNIKDNATAADFAERLQPYIENIVLSDDGKDDYVAAVDALKEEFDNLPANVQTLIPNASYMADTDYNENTYSKLRVIYEMYLARVNEFKGLLPAGDDYAEFSQWEELNAIYDKADNSTGDMSGITIPAVKDSPEMKAAIGEARITAYIEARGAHEEDIARDLSDRIAASAAKYQSATDRQELTDALVEIIKDFKPTYNKLPEDKQALVTNYQEYVKTIYIKNIEGVTNAYNDIKQKLAGSDLTTADALLDTIKEFSEAYAWGAGYDYCSSSQIAIKEWGTWVSSLKPSTLTDDEQTKVSDFNTLQRSFMQGDFAKEIAAKYTQIIKDTVSELKTKIGDCKHVSEETTWNFETLGAEKATVLEKLHVLRFLIQDMLPADEATEIWDGDANLKAFADDLGFYEINLEKEIAGA